MGLILYIIAWISDPILSVINFVVVLIKYSKSKGFLTVVNDYLYQAAVDKDRFGNHNFRTLFNLTLIKKTSKHLFGNVLETISSVLGKNQRDDTLIFMGWVVVVLLWIFVHPKHWNIGHCQYYIIEIK